jgi:beta-lactamase superfamily II metal-dependent hydrolase
MGYEVDLLSVASGGGALCVRWGVPGNYKVLVYDGGTAESGERLAAHIETHYGTTTVDYLVSSHPARDHLAGLAVVLRRLQVGELWMHRPWAHAERLGEKMRSAMRLEALARGNGVPVHEPFEGARIGPFTVLSPHERHYVNVLLPAFELPPRRAARAAPADPDAFFRTMKEWAGNAWRFEALPDDALTGARNDSSAVLYADFGGRGVLLTGSAGIPALSAAALCAEGMGIHLPSSLRFLQVPNRGRRSNVSTRLLDRIIGVRTPADERRYTKTAFVSVGRDAPQGVERTVAEALARRGVMTFAARDTNLHHAHGMPARGWHPAQPSHLKKG